MYKAAETFYLYAEGIVSKVRFVYFLLNQIIHKFIE